MEDKKSVCVVVTCYELAKKAKSVGMTEEQFVDIYLNKVKDPNLTKKEGILNFAREIFRPTQEEIEKEKIYMKENYEKLSKYGITEESTQNKLSSLSPFREFLEGQICT